MRLRATPLAGQEFLGWGGDAAGSDNPLSVKLGNSMVITARFTTNILLNAQLGRLGAYPDKYVLFDVAGGANSAYRIEQSSDLRDWVVPFHVPALPGDYQAARVFNLTNRAAFFRAVRE